MQVSGPPVTLTLNNAPAKDASDGLGADLGDYGFVYVGDHRRVQARDADSDGADYPVTMAFPW